MSAPDTERVLAAIEAMRTWRRDGGLGRGDATLALDVAEAAARLRAAQRDYDNLWRDVIPATSIVTRLSDDIHDGLKALDAALARLAEVGT